MTRKNEQGNGNKKGRGRSQKDAGVPGDSVNCGVPWIDFVAAGTAIHENRRIAWIALETMHPGLLKFATSRRVNSTNRAWHRALSPHARIVCRVLSMLHNEVQIKPANKDTFIPNIEELGTDAGSSIRIGTNLTTVDTPETLILSWEAGSGELTFSPSSPEQSLRHFGSFDDLLECVFCPLRYYYLPGWLLNAPSFLKGYLSSVESNPGKPYIHSKVQSGLPSNMAAQAIRDRLIAFGWGGPHLAYVLDQTGYGNQDKKGRNTSKSFNLDREGLQVLEIDGSSFFREDKLNISNISEEELALHYASAHPMDRAILAIEFTGYGNRSLKNERMPLDDYFLYQLPLSAVGFLCGIFPRVTTKVVTYRQPEAALRLSAIIDRLARLYMVTPDDEVLALTIKRIVRYLVYVSIDRPEIRASGLSPTECFHLFDDVLMLDSLLKDHIGEGCSTFINVSHDHEFSGMQSSIDLIQRLARSGDGSQLDALLTGLHACGEILEIDRDLMEGISDVINARSKKMASNRTYKAIDRFVRENKDLFRDLPFAGKSHTRPLTIIRHIAKFMHGIMQHEAALHDKLQKWTSDNFKFIWLMPHDPMNCLREGIMLNRGNENSGETARDKSYILNISRQNSWQSHFRSSTYNMLFSPSHVEGSIEVDMEPILAFGMRSLNSSEQPEHTGWMFKKIEQTQSMLDKLAIQTGASTDFALGNLLKLDQMKDPYRVCLELLSTSTILRCVVSVEGGEKFLHDWCQLLLSLYNAHLDNEKRGSEKIIDMDSQPQRIQFQDVYGMVGAALDCCRNKNSAAHDSLEHGFSVYFRPDMCFKYYRMRSSDEKEKYVRYSKPDKSDPYQSLLGFITKKEYSVESAIEIIDLLEEVREFQFGESIEHLFMDIRDDLEAAGKINRETSMRVDYLLKKYRMRSGSQR